MFIWIVRICIFSKDFSPSYAYFSNDFCGHIAYFSRDSERRKKGFKEGPQTFLFLIRYRSMAKSTTMNATITASAQNGNA